MRLYRNAMELISETSPLTLGILGVGALVAGPIISAGQIKLKALC